MDTQGKYFDAILLNMEKLFNLSLSYINFATENLLLNLVRSNRENINQNKTKAEIKHPYYRDS